MAASYRVVTPVVAALLVACVVPLCKAREASAVTWFTNAGQESLNEKLVETHPEMFNERGIGGLYPCCVGFNISDDGRLYSNMDDVFMRQFVAFNQAHGVPVAPTITCSVYPSLKAALLRKELFVQEAVNFTLLYGFDGFNFDVEPAYTPENNATEYALLLNAVAVGLHKHGKTVSADLASWGLLSDFEAYARHAPMVDRFVTMSTYSPDPNISKTYAYVQNMLDAGLTPSSLAPGIGTQNSSVVPHAWTQPTLNAFMTWLLKVGVQHVSVWWCPNDQWHSDVDAFFFQEFQRFASATSVLESAVVYT